VPIPCSQFVRRAAALLPMLVMLVMVLATPAAAQNTKSPLIVGGTVIPQVTPHGASVTASVGANSYVFTVKNVGTGLGVMNTYPTCSGAASACTASVASFSLAAGASRTVTMNYTGSSAGGTGTVNLEVDDASRVHSDQGYITVTVPPPPPTYIVSVTPDGAAYSMAAGTSSYNFTVANTGTGDATYTLAPSCAGMVSGCSAPASVYVAHGTSAPVGVSFSDATPGTTGTASLTASYGGYSDGGSLNVSVNNSYAVSVTPDNQSQIVSPNGSVNFYVMNLGSIQTSFNLSVNCGCSLSASTITVNPGYSSGVNVTVSLNGFAGTVVLTASDPAHGTSDTGSIIVSAPTYTVAVTPDGYPDYWFEAGQAGTATFTVSNSGNSAATYSLSGSCDPVATGCSGPPASVTVSPSSSASVPISFTAGAAGSSGYARLNASGPSSDGGTVHVLVYSHAVSVAKGGTATVYSAPGLTQVIGVTNTGNVLNSYTLTPSCSGAVSACTASPASVSNLGVGAILQVTVTYTGANAGGAGVVQLVARNTVNTGIADSGTVNVTVKPKYTVAVTPDGGTAQADAGTMASVPFVVTNNGTATSGHYTLSVTNCQGTAVHGPCTLDSTSLFVAVGVPKQVNVSFPAGAPKDTAAIAVLARSIEDTTFTDPGSVRFTVTKYAVSVTPDTLPVSPAAYATDTRTFTVTNTGTTQRTFRLQAACAPPAATACSASRDTVTLAANSGSVGVNVSYTAGDPGTTGTVRLVATDTLGSSADGGTLAVTVGASVANDQVQFKQINPGTTIERSACLVFSIVRDVADECGALRIVHPLPAVTTLGKARVPTLIYSSDQLRGPTLAVNIMLADTTTIPQSVQLTVVRTWPDGHNDTVTQTYPGTDWQAKRRRRVAVSNVASGGIGILRYSVSVSLVYAGTSRLAAPVDNSELAFVDRTNSAFGAGWWLAGLEQLFPGQYDGSVLWVGGDGSTRKYVNQHTAVAGTSDSVYLAAAFDRPDTLLLRSDGKYRRQAANGLYVEFDGLGLHKRTVNRLKYETDFNYDGNSHLSTLQLPPWQGTAPAFTYTFTYNPSSQLLDAVTAPSVNTKPRSVTLTRLGVTHGVQTITELLGDSTYSVGFEFPAGGALTYAARLDRRNVRTSFVYEDSSRTISSFATATGTGADTVRHTFRTVGAVGAAGASANLDTAYFRYDGPRPAAVGDTTLFWLDRFGGPTRIVDAMGHETRIARGDPRFPGLATEVRGPLPNKFTTWASYDDRGNLRASTHVSPHGDGIDATTMYLWHPKWDMVTRIVQPEGEVTNIAYNDTTGNRVSQDDGRGLMSRVNFQYYDTTDVTTGKMKRLLSGVTLPITATLPTGSSIVKYDILGNVNTTVTPRGTTAVTTNDAIGRTVGVRNQISDAGDTTSTSVTFDLSDRVTRSVSYGPGLNGSSAQWVTVDNGYDREGRLQSVTRSQSPDTSRTYQSTDYYPALGTLVSRYKYDDLGRKVAEIAPDSTPTVDTDNPVDSTFYDLAGNITSVRTRRNDHVVIADPNHVILMTYDALNRLKTRVVPDAKYRARVDGYALSGGIQDTVHAGYNTPYPRFFNNIYSTTDSQLNYPNWGGYTVSGFTATYDYDEAGNMTIADNADARVRRQYYPNGQMRYDSLYTKTLQRDTVHMYGLKYLYDRDGRMTTLNHPAQLSGGTSGYQTTMQYDPVTGALSTVVDPLGNAFTYGYDARSQVLSLTMPTGVSESYDYDQEGDILTHWAGAPAGNTPFPGTVHDVKMTYDRRGKMLTLWNAVAAKDTINMAYSGLGYLVYNDHVSWQKGDPLTRYQTTEHFTFDPLGNRLHSDFSYLKLVRTSTSCNNPINTCYSSTTQGGDQANSYYRLGTGRLVFDDHSSINANSQNQTKYDEAGNIVFSTQKPNTSPSPVYEDRASFYGADGTLAAVDYRQISSNNQFFHTVFDEYRYDALGRRILVRSQRRCGTEASDCGESYVRRTVWAGAQELYEIQMPDNPIARENDTAAVAVKQLGYLNYDPNPLYGRVAFTFGLKLDQPLSVTRLRYMNSFIETWAPFSIVPFWTVRGTADSSYFAATGKTNCNATRCVLVSYGDEYWTPSWRRYFAPPTFQGTLLTDKADHTGQLFRRNRYYDPATGRFTQEDPIGLAGGLNAYGFAGGDPVNFSDPFGLCPIPANDCPPGYFTGLGLAAGAGAGVLVAGACTISTEGICGLLAEEIVGGLTGLGASLGARADASNGTALPSLQLRRNQDESADGHTKDPRESTRERHEKGDERRRRDQGGEKGDSRRVPNPNKRGNPKKPTDNTPEDPI
jgi:RHS repeat-associated protein